MFSIGTRVSEKVSKTNARYENPPPVGKVIAQTDDPNVVVVKWDKRWAGDTVNKVKTSALMLEADAKAEYDRLSEEFSKLQTACRERVQEAANKLTEAVKMAEAGGQDLHEMYEAVGPLLRAMDAAGWSTSSLHC